MRKQDTHLTIKNILQQGYLLTLATVDKDGPWAADVIYIFDDDLNLYWMSDPAVRHSQAIESDSRVAATITVSGARENNLGLQIQGIAQKIVGSRYDLAIKHFTKRGHKVPTENEDVLHGDSWYVLRPKKFDIIDEENHGFDKVHVVID